MRRQLEGSRAIAQTVALCRPNVIPAYPITPQTHIVEALSVMIRQGTLVDCAFLTVESEFSALSAAIGGSAVGGRAYTATASQGLLYMTEALFNAAGLGFPIVMTVANRAIGAPINIWNDHSDAMAVRDCGWIQLYAADNQAAVDLHPLAFRLAEQVSLPVMVCVDGFVLTHAFEPIDVPSQAVVDELLPAFEPRQVLSSAAPAAIGAMVGPEAFTEVRYLADASMLSALPAFDALAEEYANRLGRSISAVEGYRTEDAEVIVVALGSVSGTIADVVDELRATGHPVGLVTVTLFRPFPYRALRELTGRARRVLVINRAVTAGASCAVTSETRAALAGTPVELIEVVAGLGGRPVTSAAIKSLLCEAERGSVSDRHYLDLDTAAVPVALGWGTS